MTSAMQITFAGCLIADNGVKKKREKINTLKEKLKKKCKNLLSLIVSVVDQLNY